MCLNVGMRVLLCNSTRHRNMPYLGVLHQVLRHKAAVPLGPLVLYCVRADLSDLRGATPVVLPPQ